MFPVCIFPYPAGLSFRMLMIFLLLWLLVHTGAMCGCRLRCRYNHSERKNHTKFFAEPPPHWSTTISHRLAPSLHPLLQTNHPFLFVFHQPLSTESLPLHL